MPFTEEINAAIKKRGYLKRGLTSFEKFMRDLVYNDDGTIDDATLLIEIQERINRIESLFEEFSQVQATIELGVPEEYTETQAEEREKFEKTFFQQVAKAKKLLAGSSSDIVSNNSQGASVRSEVIVHHQDNIAQSIRLPKIDLPKFGGQYENWLEFRDTFQSLIHENQIINDIQRFYYLRASLTGDAAQVIKSLELSADNYQHAWDIITKRYNNTRLLVDNHVQALFNLERLTKESSSNLRKLIDDVSKNLRALGSLGQKTEHWDTLIIHMITTKLDDATIREWQLRKSDNELPTLEDLKKFLNNQADLLETLENKRLGKKEFRRQDMKQDRQSNTRSFLVATNTVCSVCKGEHNIYNCEKFLKLSAEERISKSKEKKLCLNCLKPGHFANICKSGSCKHCKSKHNSLLHLENPQTQSNAATQQARTNQKTENPKQEGQVNTTLTSHGSSECNVLLPTARVKLRNEDGNLYTVVALLDSASQSNYITSDLCKRLNIGVKQQRITVMGLNETSSTIEAQCETEIQSIDGKYRLKLSCLVTPVITSCMPNFQIDRFKLQIPNDIELANPDFDKPTKVELLIGAQHFWNLLCVGRIVLGKRDPILQKTRLGWVVSGPIESIRERRVVHCHFVKKHSRIK